MEKITISATVDAPIEKVWDCWTKPEHITQWNNASPDWHTPSASNDLKVGGSFTIRMEAKDGSMGFDFGGTYDEVIPQQHIRYTLGDGRVVNIAFTVVDQGVLIVEQFDPENENPVDMQQMGWQSILNNFKTYTETQ